MGAPGTVRGEGGRSPWRRRASGESKMWAPDQPPVRYNVLMPRPGSIFSVLIASPSDVNAERGAIKQSLYAWNSANTRFSSVIIDPVMWESHSQPEAGGHPQVILNKQIVEWCDIAIACFWSTPGTATPNAESGTIEEVEHFIRSGKPVMLYFCARDIPQSMIDQDSLSRLNDFKSRMKDQCIYGEYETVEDLELKLSHDLQILMNRIAQQGHYAIPSKIMHQLSESDSAMSARHDNSVYSEMKDGIAESARLFKLSWLAEKDSTRPKYEEGKFVAGTLKQDLIRELSKIDEEWEGAAQVISHCRACIQMADAIEKESPSLGKTYFESFWNQGDKLIDALSELVKILARLTNGIQ